MKKKKMLILLSTVGLLAFGTVTSLAVSNYLGQTKTQVTTGGLHVTLSQNSTKVEEEDFKGPIMPMDTIPKELFVSTSGTYNQYLRISCDRYWTSLEDGYQIETDADPSLIGLQLKNEDDWIVVEDTKHNGHLTLYYKFPVKPNTKIQVLDNILIGNIPSDSQNLYAHKGLQIDSKAEGIQQIGNKNDADFDAIKDVWGVDATISSDGTITKIQ